MHLLYSAAIVCYALSMSPRLLYEAVRHGKYVGTLRERWGHLPEEIDPGGRPSIWIHAVSVGEVQAARTLIPGLRDRYPGHRLWLSTTTRTGRAVAAGIEAVDGVFYFPPRPAARRRPSPGPRAAGAVRRGGHRAVAQPAAALRPARG